MSEEGVVDAGDRMVAINPRYFNHAKLDWIIVGGESGPHARPMDPDWARAIRDQCAAAGVPFFFKQWGRWLPMDQTSPDDDFGVSFAVFRDGNGGHRDRAYSVGKRRAGRLLGGFEHNAFPESRQ